MNELLRRVARRRQERAETLKEMANLLYKYNGPSLISNGCALCHGDYMMANSATHGLETSRNVHLDASPARILEMIDSGSLSKVFDPDDLNADNFGKRMDYIMDVIGVQSHYHDAPIYFKDDEHDTGLAMYVAEHDVEEFRNAEDKISAYTDLCGNTEFCIEKTPTTYKLHKGVEDVDWGNITSIRECSYEEFNPGSAEIREVIAGLNTERQNVNTARAKLMEMYQANGNTEITNASEVISTDDINKVLSDKSISSAEALMQARAMMDMQQQQTLQMQQQAIENGEMMEEDQYPPLPGQRGYRPY